MSVTNLSISQLNHTYVVSSIDGFLVSHTDILTVPFYFQFSGLKIEFIRAPVLFMMAEFTVNFQDLQVLDSEMSSFLMSYHYWEREDSWPADINISDFVFNRVYCSFECIQVFLNTRYMLSIFRRNYPINLVSI